MAALPDVSALERVTRLHALASALSAAITTEDVAQIIVSHGAEATGACCGVLALPEGRELVLGHLHRFGDAEEAPRRLPRDAPAPMPTAMRECEPVLLGSRAEWLERFPAIPPRSDFESFAAVPLLGKQGAVGCLGLGFAQTQAFDEADVELLQVVARQGAQALERAVLYEQREHVARTLQHGLLPGELPGIPGLQLAAAYQPMTTGHEVGGDFYDVFATESGWCMAIGDVCGKGVEAAVVTGMVRHTLRALELGHGDPSSVLRRLNLAVCRHAPADRFCSVVLVHLAPVRGGFRVDIGNAGHPPPLLAHAGGGAEELDAFGGLLGVEDIGHPGAARVLLRPGDALVLYTDGIVEARRAREQFGWERLLDVVGEASGRAAHEIAGAIQDAVAAFAPGPPADDQALLVIRVDE